MLIQLRRDKESYATLNKILHLGLTKGGEPTRTPQPTDSPYWLTHWLTHSPPSALQNPKIQNSQDFPATLVTRQSGWFFRWWISGCIQNSSAFGRPGGGGGRVLVLGEGGTAAMASRPDPDGPRQKGLDGPLYQQTIVPSSLSKAAAQTKADIKIFSINACIYIIPLWTQNFQFFAQRYWDMNLVKSQSWKEHFDNQEHFNEKHFNEKHFKKSDDLRRILETAAELKLQPLCRRALQLLFWPSLVISWISFSPQPFKADDSALQSLFLPTGEFFPDHWLFVLLW